MTNDWNTFALLSAPTDLPGLNSVLCQGAAVCTSQLPQPWIKHVQEGRRNRSSFCMADILVRLKKAFLSLTLRQYLVGISLKHQEINCKELHFKIISSGDISARVTEKAMPTVPGSQK